VEVGDEGAVGNEVAGLVRDDGPGDGRPVGDGSPTGNEGRIAEAGLIRGNGTVADEGSLEDGGQAREGSAAAEPVDDDGAADSEDSDVRGELLPVLWSGSSPRAGLLEAVPHWPVAAGRLHLALAVVAPTPRGTIGMFHVTHEQLGELSFNALMAEALENLAAELHVEGRETEDGPLLSLSGTLVSAAVCLPDFYRRLSDIVDSERLVVGLPGPDEVYVAAAESPLAQVIHRVVLESECPAGELVPAVLSIAGDEIEVLSERD
jgi:hypothetical protein